MKNDTATLWEITVDGDHIGDLTGYSQKEAESKARLIWKLSGDVKAEKVKYE